MYICKSRPLLTTDYSVRPLDDLMYAPMTMGMQGDFYGLCNSVLISEPHSSFVGRYIDSYRQFRQEWWDWNSVVRSFELARAHPTEVQVLKESAFFVPNWDRAAIVFEGDEHDVDASGQYLYVWRWGRIPLLTNKGCTHGTRLWQTNWLWLIRTT